MPEKPPFDPSKPHEPVDMKPPFDPNLPHEEVATDEGPGIGEKVLGAAKWLGGAGSDLLTAIQPRIPVVQSGIEYLANQAFSNTPEQFEKMQAAQQAERQRVEERFPTASMAGSLMGSAFLPAAPALRTAEGAGLLARGAAGAANAVSRVGYGAGQSAAEAALTGHDPKEAAIMAAKFGGGLEGLGAVAKGTRAIAGQTFFGVKPKTEAYYRENAPAVNEITAEDARAELVKKAERVRDFAANKEKALETTKAEQRDLLRGAKEDASTAIDRHYQEGQQKIAEYIKSAEPTPDQAMDILDSAKKLRKEISKKSGEAFDVLNAQDKLIPTSRFKAITTQKMNELKIAGRDTPLTDADIAPLREFRQTLDMLPNNARPEDVKRIVQALDAKSEAAWAKSATGGGYVGRGDRALMDIRSFIDDELKAIPEYAAAMGPVAEKTRALSQFNDFFSSPVTAQRSLKAAQKDSFQKKALENFDEIAGTDYATKVANQAKESAEGVAGVKSAQKQLEENLKAKLNEQRLASEKAVGGARSDFESAQEWYRPVRGISEVNADNYLRAAQMPSGRNVQNKLDTLNYLDEFGHAEGDQSLTKMAKDLAVKNALEQGFTHGSRNVNLGAQSIGGVLGQGAKALGLGHQNPIFGAVGAVAGALADVMGPKVYKKILDMEMNPNFQRAAFALKQAAQRSPASVILTHRLLEKQDPNYREYMEGNP